MGVVSAGLRGIPLLMAVAALSCAASAGPSRSGRPPASALCVVHADPVPDEMFAANWALLEELVETADAYGAKLSIHFTGSYASQARRSDKAAQVRGWIARGHGAGTHAHPEYLDEGRWRHETWPMISQRHARLAVEHATEAVNRLVGAERNKVLDTLVPFYTSPAWFPEQFTHNAWGNNGHGAPVPIVLAGGRRLTGVFYRNLPGNPPRDTLHMSAAQLLGEFDAAQSAYGPVLHPADFRADTREELVAWFAGVKARGAGSARIEDIRDAARSGEMDANIRLSVRAQGSALAERRLVVRVANGGERPAAGLRLQVHLPPDFPRVRAVEPAGGESSGTRPVFTVEGLTVPPGSEVSRTFVLAPAERPSHHPIGDVADAYLDGPEITPRWSLTALVNKPDEGWFLPFESYNPAGKADADAERKTPFRFSLDRSGAESLLRELRERPTNAGSLRLRLRALEHLALELLTRGRRTDVDSVLPPERFHALIRQAERGDTEGAARGIDEALRALAGMLP